MSEIQATISIQIELGRFHNVDLFQRGFYQLRLAIKLSPKIPSIIKFSANKSKEDEQHLPSCLINNIAHSKVFQILYRREDIVLDDVFTFDIHLLVNALKIDECISDAEITIGVELCFSEEDVSMSTLEKMSVVSRRSMELNVRSCVGVHHHLPLLFDYFHLCAIELTIHAALTSLNQPTLSFSRNQNGKATKSESNLLKLDGPSPLEQLLFGGPIQHSTKINGHMTKSRRTLVCHRHKELCCALLSAYESLQMMYIKLTNCLRTKKKIYIEYVDCFKELEQVSNKCKKFMLEKEAEEEDILQSVLSDLTNLSSRNTLLWLQFIEVFTHSKPVAKQLAQEHHIQRVKRFSEGFFVKEHMKSEALACFENGGQSHCVMASKVRNSNYFQMLPPLDVICNEMDGDSNTLPVIFEDAYTEPCTSSIVSANSVLRNKVSASTRSLNSNSSGESLHKLNRLSKMITGSISESIIGRPLSLMTSSDAGSQVATEPNDCLLVGYRRTTPIHPSLSPIELGTFSRPSTLNPREFIPDSPPPLSNVLAQSHALQTGLLSAGSMPDLKSSTMPNNMARDDSFVAALKPDNYSMHRGSLPDISPRIEMAFRAPLEVWHNGNDLSQLGGSDIDQLKDLRDRKMETIGENLEEMKHNEEPKKSTDVDSGIVANATRNHGDSTSDEAVRTVHIVGDGDIVVNINVDPPPPPAVQSKMNILEFFKMENEKRIAYNDDPNQSDKSGQSNAGDGDADRTVEVDREAMYVNMGTLRQRLVSKVTDETVKFSAAKEALREQIGYSGHFYSDFFTQINEDPYFWSVGKPLSTTYDGLHLIICVHGLDGNSTDLRLVRTYLELALSPIGGVDFLMSERNQIDTFSDFDVMTDRLVQEILYHIDLYSTKPTRISFIGHSLGNIIIRSAMSRPQMAPLLPRLHTFLSLSGPHLGMLYNPSGLVNMGIWLMQKWKKSGSLLQLALRDHNDPRQTFIYKLSQKTGLEFFRNILLVGSQQDRYVPFHSSRIEVCRAAVKDSSVYGSVYAEMVSNILQPIIYKSDVNFVRFDVFHALPSTTNHLIGRAAHIAVLDSELFIEKFITVSALKYFR